MLSAGFNEQIMNKNRLILNVGCITMSGAVPDGGNRFGAEYSFREGAVPRFFSENTGTFSECRRGVAIGGGYRASGNILPKIYRTSGPATSSCNASAKG